MAIEQKYIDIYLNHDGSLSGKSAGNVFQFTNEFVGVRMFCPYSSEDVLAFINVQLPDGTLLGEKGMMVEPEITEDGVTWYPYTYVFPEIVTSRSGSKFSSFVVIAFRLLDKESLVRSLNSVLVPITVQPSLKGTSAEIADPTAYQDLLDKINQLSLSKQNIVDQTLETVSKRVSGAINELNARDGGEVGGVGGFVDKEMSDSSTNAVQNKVIKAYVDDQIASAVTDVLNEEV